MFRRTYDILCVGDIATDAFIRLEDPHIHAHVNHDQKEICLPFASKIPFEYVKVVKAAGNAANAGVAASRLGLKIALLSNIGDDENGRDCLAELMRNGVTTSHIKVHKTKPTNYHFVLWYGSERTILVNHTRYDCHLADRHSYATNNHGTTGANTHIEPGFAPPKWMYLTSMAADTYPYHMEIADYLDAHPEIRLAFQPGTYQIKLGPVELKRLYARADFLAVNMEEAKRIVEASPRSLSRPDLVNEASPRGLASQLAALGPKLVAITDGPKGAYLYDGDHMYFMPPYPDPRPPFERTGCGDAWTATFLSALALGLTPLEALTWAAVNPMSVAQYVGAQEGLLTREQLEWWLARAPENYRPREI